MIPDKPLFHSPRWEQAPGNRDCGNSDKASPIMCCKNSINKQRHPVVTIGARPYSAVILSIKEEMPFECVSFTLS